MPRPLLALLAAALLVVGLGCAGLGNLDLSGEPPPSPAWVGRWEGPGMTMDIGPDGMVGVSRHGDNTSSDLRAPAQAWKPDAIEIGIAGITTRYRIDEAPYEKDGVWRMVIEGVPLERVSTPVADTDAAHDSDQARAEPIPTRFAPSKDGAGTPVDDAGRLRPIGYLDEDAVEGVPPLPSRYAPSKGGAGEAVDPVE